MTIRDDLIAAKALIDTPEKWGKGSDRSQPCALQALRSVEGGTNYLSLRGYLALCYAIPEESPYRHFGHPAHPFVGGYNDDPSTTHADIMALFDRAIVASPE